MQLVKSACLDRHADLCVTFGKLVGRLKLEEEYDFALMKLQQACGAGYLEACYVLATGLEDGTFGQVDYWAAGHVAARACELDHMPSCNAVGHMVVEGHGFDRDPLKGVGFFYYACAKHYAPACASMGQAIEEGWGVQSDPEMARKYYERACSLGYAGACDNK